MKVRLTLVILVFALTCGNLYALDLTGIWTCNDGGTYYLRQIGQQLYWYGEQNAAAPSWANVFVASVQNDEVSGKWHDIPKGEVLGSGTLLLNIRNNGNTLTARHENGGFGGSSWNRSVVVPPIHISSCSISGRLMGGESYWNITYVGIRGPDDFSKHPTDPVRVASDGSYSFVSLKPGKYKVYTDIHADVGVGFKPGDQNVTCKGQVADINFQWPPPK
ncbi:MAG TPA: hypothetical protein DCE18_07305 [Syntrophobacteraceae bacterium]|nr:hypothetical protein [Syntrophobacteraceae bacterium]